MQFCHGLTSLVSNVVHLHLKAWQYGHLFVKARPIYFFLFGNYAHYERSGTVADGCWCSDLSCEKTGYFLSVGMDHFARLSVEILNRNWME